jgi:FKBP-type peptidyl-prolyl cis-trans isomerase
MEPPASWSALRGSRRFWFPFDTPGARAQDIVHAPAAFRRRGVFVADYEIDAAPGRGRGGGRGRLWVAKPSGQETRERSRAPSCRGLRCDAPQREVSMRRRHAAALAITPLLAIAALAGGASVSASAASVGSAMSAGSSASPAVDTCNLVTVTGAFGKAPKVKIPAVPGSGALYIKTVIKGTGTKLTKAQSLIGDFALYDWRGKTHKLIFSTYSTGLPTLFAGPLLPGLEKALIGQKLGSRVLAVLPPADAFGASGDPSIGVGPTDTVVFVVDMLTSVGNTAGPSGKWLSNGGGALPTVTAGRAGKGPKVTIPKTAAPETLRIRTLIKGGGPKVTKGEFIVVQYAGVIWRTKKAFDSTWSRRQPFGTTIGVGQVIEGWDKGLVGQTVGSRVLLVIPPIDGYGPAGDPSAGIKGTDTIVFAVDILAAASSTR